MTIQRPQSTQAMPADAKLVFKGKLFDVYQWEQEMYDGSFQTFEKLKRADTAIVIAVTEDKKILITEQEQPGKEAFLGFPGGRLEEGEDVLVGAQRELEEETGYVSEDWSLLNAIHPLTKIDWVLYFLVAKNSKKQVEQHLDTGEKIKLRFVEFDELIDLLCEGKMQYEPELTMMALRAKLYPEQMDELREKILGS
jgi:ADP-ribose pyrophosphatase